MIPIKNWLRVISRAPALSRRVTLRKPSCLVSGSQFGPAGGCLAGEGRHGSMNPTRRGYAYATWPRAWTAGRDSVEEQESDKLGRADASPCGLGPLGKTSPRRK